MAVIAILECRFKPEHVEAGADWLRTVLVATRAFDGCLGVEVFQDRDDPARFLAVEHWASLEHDRVVPSMARRRRPGPGRCRAVRGPSQSNNRSHQGRRLERGPRGLFGTGVRATFR